jgi:putative heme-binding domain-containing protein
LKILIDSDSTNLKVLCGKLLNDPEMQVLAVRGLTKFEDLKIGKRLVDKLPDFSRQELDEVVGFLCGRVNWTGFMLEEMEKGNISRSVISPYHATQILALNNKELNEKLDRVWGVVRTSPDTMSERKIELKKELNAGHLANANLVNGRTHYDLQCGACHKLYGQGGKLGPDLTGSGRSNLDYLLENIVDPDSAVSADYRMNIIHLKDGRTLSGMIAGQDRNSLTLRMPGSDTVVSKSMVEKRETLSHSIMPAGLLDNLSLNARRDLIAYLMNPTQVSRPAQ